MKNIQVVKIGTMVNLSIDGKLYKKNCSNETDAHSFFKTVLKAKENPTDENIKAIRMFLNEKNRKALIAGIESDVETGEAYLGSEETFNTKYDLFFRNQFRRLYNRNINSTSLGIYFGSNSGFQRNV